MNEATKQAILSAVRSILIIFGSIITAHGYASDESVKEVIGALMAAIPIAWGVWDKYQVERKAAAREAVALNAGIAVVNASPTNVSPVHPAEAPAIIKEFSPQKEGK